MREKTAAFSLQRKKTAAALKWPSEARNIFNKSSNTALTVLLYFSSVPPKPLQPVKHCNVMLSQSREASPPMSTDGVTPSAVKSSLKCCDELELN